MEGYEMKGNWIPLTDQLPEPNTEVLASYDNGEVDIVLQWWAYGQEPVYSDWGEGKPADAKMTVLAWMPVPKAYQWQENVS